MDFKIALVYSMLIITVKLYPASTLLFYNIHGTFFTV